MTSVPTFRAFVAITPTRQDIRELQLACAELKQQLPSTTLRWLPTHNWHITLKFLGQLTTQQLQQLCNQLQQRLAAEKSFQLQLTSIDWFPNPKKPAVLAAIGADCPALNRLAEFIDAAAAQQGVPLANKPLRAHLSLARCRSKPAPEAGALLPLTLAPTTLTTHHLQLIRSQTFPSGAVYSKLASFPLLT